MIAKAIKIKIKNKNMQKVHQGQDIISLYNTLVQTRVGQIIKVKHGLLIALISAFFVGIFAIAVLQISRNYSILSSNPPSFEEKVAYEPGNFINQYIAKGYLGR